VIDRVDEARRLEESAFRQRETFDHVADDQHGGSAGAAVLRS